jgi:hypothetical protein
MFGLMNCRNHDVFVAVEWLCVVKSEPAVIPVLLDSNHWTEKSWAASKPLTNLRECRYMTYVAPLPTMC